MSPRLALAISLALTAPCAGAASYEPFVDSVVELRINDQPQPVTLIVRRDTDGTLLLSAADLKELRITAPARGVVPIESVIMHSPCACLVVGLASWPPAGLR